MLPVTYLKPAEKYFKKLVEKPLKRLYLDAIQTIRTNPYAGKLKTGDLAGIRGYDIYYQGTNYELAYRIEENDDGELIVVILAGTRENFYEQLKRYMKN
ncbi:type II toxin-antitoxin system RelE/ParE family toxin [Paenibacillus kandeliae]|uniref:type II toxin-antitoxin system RelE/ParE family toxin n=1 Tax=Paenibacillus kandeliae TaxID=3231269 RepID=UPI003457FEDD